MKKYYNIISLTLTLFFIGGVIFYILKINSLPGNIFHSLATSNLITEIYLILGCGVLALVFSQIAIKSSNGKEVVYVDKITKNTEDLNHKKETENSSSENFDKIIEMLNGMKHSNPLSSADGQKVLATICNHLKAGQGIIYKIHEEEKPVLKGWVTYAYLKEKSDDLMFEIGEGLPGLVAKENKYLGLDNIPEGYINILSGLGSSSPKFLMIHPIRQEDVVVGVLEIALFWKPDQNHEIFFQRICEYLGKVMGTVENIEL